MCMWRVLGRGGGGISVQCRNVGQLSTIYYISDNLKILFNMRNYLEAFHTKFKEIAWLVGGIL